MRSVLIAFLLTPAGMFGQGPQLTPGDVRAIQAAVVEELVPPEGKLGMRPTKDRPLLIDQDQMAAVMRQVAGGPAPPSLALSRPFRAVGRADAIKCAEPPRGDCQVVDDGIYATISDAAFLQSSGELRVHASVMWTHARSAKHDLNGYEVDLFFAHSNLGWRIVRRGPYITG